MKIKVIFLFLFLCAFTQGGEIDKVVGVHDGDTITLLTSDNQSFKVRLYGIDSPELKQPGGKKAKQFLSSICFGKEVRIEKLGIDRYQRVIGWLYTIDGMSINKMMVDSGWAWDYKQYSKKHPELQIAEDSAKARGKNIWSMKHPIEPWLYRSSKKKK